MKANFPQARRQSRFCVLPLHLFRRGLVLMALTFFLSGCGSKEPSAVPVVKAKPVIPSPSDKALSSGTNALGMADQAATEAELKRSEAERAERARWESESQKAFQMDGVSAGSNRTRSDGGGSSSSADQPSPAKAVPDPMEIK